MHVEILAQNAYKIIAHTRETMLAVYVQYYTLQKYLKNSRTWKKAKCHKCSTLSFFIFQFNEKQRPSARVDTVAY
jgi:hypothetical protein